MTKEQMLKNFIDTNLENFENAKSGLEALKMLGEAIENHVGAFEEISEIFQKRGLGNLWVECPDCFSPVLLNYKDCNICGRELLSGEEEAPKEVKKPASKKKAVKKATKKEEEVEEEVEEAPKKVAKKVTKKKAGKKVAKKVVKKVVEEPEEEEGDEPDYPSEDKVNVMDKADLIALNKKEKLGVDLSEFKGRGATEKLREAINDAIDYRIEQENSDENDTDVEDEPEAAVLVTNSEEEGEEEELEEEELEEEEEGEEEEDFDFEFGDDEDEEEE